MGIIPTKLVGVLGIVKIFPLGAGLGGGDKEWGFWCCFCRFWGFLEVWAGFGRGLDHLFVRTAGTSRGQKPAIVKIQRVRRYLL